MKLLLDTHALIWWLADTPALSKIARDAIEDPDNEALVSAASAMEVVTKHRLGELPGAALLAQGFSLFRFGTPRSPVDSRSRTRTRSIDSLWLNR